MTHIKICGITNVVDARVAATAGADFLGFIFYPKSPRYIAPEQVGSITQALRAEFAEQAPRFVGVFVNTPVDAVRATIRVAGLDLAQLHGAETPADVAALAPYAFKALRPQTMAEAQVTFTAYVPASSPIPHRLPATPDLLVDTYHPQQLGGTGQTADLTIACWLASRCRLLLAGGLTPDNVAAVIARVQPWGVDVSSGVEITKGKKDHNKVRAFIKAVSNSAISSQQEPKNR